MRLAPNRPPGLMASTERPATQVEVGRRASPRRSPYRRTFRDDPNVVTRRRLTDVRVCLRPHPDPGKGQDIASTTDACHTPWGSGQAVHVSGRLLLLSLSGSLLLIALGAIFIWIMGDSLKLIGAMLMLTGAIFAAVTVPFWARLASFRPRKRR